MIRLLRERWFLIALAVVVVLGYSQPAVRHILPQSYVLQPAIFFMLFLISLTLPYEGLRRSFANAKGLTSAAIGSYLIIPALVSLILLLPIQVDLKIGFAIIAAVPTTLASAAIFARAARGNDALALVSTLLGNLSSFATVPLLLWILVGNQVSLAVDQLLLIGAQLVGLVIFPVAAGQLARRFVPKRIDRARNVFSGLAQVLILLVVLSSVAKASSILGQQLTLGQGILLVGGVVSLNVCASIGCWLVASAFGASRPDRIAVLFSGAQKTLPLGVYLAAVHFSDLKYAMFPILLYHPIQLIIGSLIISRLQSHHA